MTFDFTINWPVIFTLIGAISVGIVVWYRTQAQVQKNTDGIEKVSKEVDKANAMVASALAKAEDKAAVIAKELSDYKLQVAKDYATNQAMSVIEERIVAAIERLGDRLDKFLDTPRLPRSGS